MARGTYSSSSMTVWQRLLDRLVIGDECWSWQGGHTTAGYSSMSLPGRRTDYVHRVVYRLLRGPIPAELVVDHLCRNRGCVNPWHLELVPGVVNTRRGASAASTSARYAARTSCVNGHALTRENVRLDPLPTGRFRRTCRACEREKLRRRRAAARQA